MNSLGDGTFLGELLPITFVSANPVSVKSEVLDDVSVSSDADLQFKNSHAENSFHCNSLASSEGERDLVANSLTKREIQEETNVCGVGLEVTRNASFTKATGNNSASDIVSCTQEMTHSRNESVTNSECYRTMNESFDMGVASACNENPKGDLQVKLEPICEIYEHNMKEEKAFETGLDLGNTEDGHDERLCLKMEIDGFEGVGDESSHHYYQEDSDQRFSVANTSTLKAEETTVSLEKSPSFHQKEVINDDSDLDIKSGSLRMHPKKPIQEADKLKCSTEQKENSLSCPESDPFRSEIKCDQPRSENSFNDASHLQTPSVEKTFQCTSCTASFGLETDLNAHSRVHQGEKRFSCEVCGTFFARKSKLLEHERTHTGEKPFSCEICSKAFTVKQNLKRHMQIHAGGEQWICTICCASLSDRYLLMLHKRTHRGDRPYLCPFCPSRFELQSNLKAHLRIHTGEYRSNAHERPFPCDRCGIAFNRKVKLAEHMRTHTGEKPFSCEICRAAFSLKPNLRRHLKTHFV